MCKSSMACLQMIKNSLTVKFHYLCCFEPLHLYRYRHRQVLSAPLLYSHQNGHLSRVHCNLKRQYGIFLSVRSISAVTCTGISFPICTGGDLLWFLSMTLAQTTHPLSRKNGLLWKFLWARDSKTASKALGRGKSIAIVTVISLEQHFNCSPTVGLQNLFINVKPVETALKRIRDRPTVMSARHFNLVCLLFLSMWVFCCSSLFCDSQW